MALVALAAAAISGLVVYLATNGNSTPKASTTVQSTPTVTTTNTPTAIPKGLQGVVLKPVWDQCAVPTTPTAGAVQSVVCLPPSNPTSFFPDRIDLSIYPNGASLKKAFDALKTADPKSAALVAGKGNCNGVSWNGDGIWKHEDTGKLGGHRFCYFDANDNAVIVWTHEKLNTPSHIDTLAVARVGGRGNEPGLFSWWNFWHGRLGKCPLPRCVARLP